MLWSEAVDVRATVEIDDVFLTRVMLRRDRPNKMAIDRPPGDQILAVEAFRRLAVGPVAAFNALPHAIDGPLHAQDSQKNVYRLALDAGHASSPVPRGNRITFAVCDRRDFVSGFRAKSYERPGFCRHVIAMAQIAEHKRPAAINIGLRRL